MINRRELGRLVGASLAGAAIFEPSASELLVSVWSADGGNVRVEVFDHGDLVHAAELELGDAGTGALDVGGLAPSRAYDVRVTTEHGARIGT